MYGRKGVRAVSLPYKHFLQLTIITISHYRSKDVVDIVIWDLTFSKVLHLSQNDCPCSEQRPDIDFCPCVEAKVCLKYQRKFKKFADGVTLGELFFNIIINFLLLEIYKLVIFPGILYAHYILMKLYVHGLFSHNTNLIRNSGIMLPYN